MAETVRSLEVPELSNSDFSGGHIAWNLIQSAARLLESGGVVDRIDLSRVRHLRPYGVAIIAAMARLNRSNDKHVFFQEPQNFVIREHLERLRLPEIVSVGPVETIALRPTNLPIRVLEGRPNESFGWDTTEVLLGELGGANLPAGCQPAIAESIDEVVLNAVTHADSPIGCVVVGQAFPQTGVLEVAVLDLGMTIRGHLAQTHPNLNDNAAAIELALQDGITGTIGRNRFNEPNSGAGLPALATFLDNTGGELAILSGSAIVCLDREGRRRNHDLRGPPFRGTLVNISFATKIPSAGVGSPTPTDL